MKPLSICLLALLLPGIFLAGCEYNPFTSASFFRKSATGPSVPPGGVGGAAGAELAGGFNPATMKIVASVRHYYATAQRSTHQLLLYRGDGTLVRPLTTLEGVNDLNPVFSPDGNEVCFTRKKVAKNLDVPEGFYLIADLGNPSPEQHLDQAPEWYQPRNEAAADQAVFSPHQGKGLGQGEPLAQRFTSPEGRFEIIIHYNFRQDKGQSDARGGFAGDVTFRLVDRQTSTTERLAQMRGFERLSHAWLIHQTPYLYEGPLKLAFFCGHIGSTDGSSFYALDLNRKSLIKLSPNGGVVIPVQGVPGFFFVDEERYQPLGDGKTKVNCKYLDFWDGGMKRTRYAPAISAFGGAAVYIPGRGAIAIP